MKKKLFALLAALCCFAMTACSSAGAISTYTISLNEMPKNFDPQVATEDNELMVLANIYDGLFEYIDGTIQPNVCESWTVSADGLHYIFNLRTDSTFFLSKKEQIPVTSKDFAFALQRVLDPSTRSPYYNDFKHIDHVISEQDYVLEIKLKHSDPNFLHKLCSPAAYPCNYDFFRQTNGAYGLRVNDILSNGPYTINYLADDGSYATLIRVDGNEKAISRIRISRDNGETDVVTQYQTDKISGFFAGTADIHGLEGTVYSFENQNFNMVFNTDRYTLSSADVRGALAYYSYGMENSGANLAAVNQSHSIFNSSVVFDGTAVTSLLEGFEPQYMNQSPKEMLVQGLAQLELTKAENLKVLIPSDVNYKVVAENINQLWQKELGLFFTLELIPNSEIEKRVEAGNFDIAFFNSQPVTNHPLDTLQLYQNLDDELHSCVTALEQGGLSSNESVQLINQAHNIIIDKAYIVPMCTDSSEYIHKIYFKGIEINPFGNIINLKYATVK